MKTIINSSLGVPLALLSASPRAAWSYLPRERQRRAAAVVAFVSLSNGLSLLG